MKASTVKERCGRQKEGRRNWATNWSPYQITKPRPSIYPRQQPRPAGENLSYSMVNFEIERVKAVKFGPGVLGVETPVDSGLGGVAFLNQGLDFLPERLLVG